MGTLYLIDAHTSVLANSNVIETVPYTSGSVLCNGAFPVMVSDRYPLASPPTNLGDLLTKKAAAIVAGHPGYTNYVFDGMLDASTVNATSSTGAKIGSRCNISLPGRGASTLDAYCSYLFMTAVTVGITATRAVLYAEAFKMTTDESVDPLERRYTECPASDLTYFINFHNGGDGPSVTPEVAFDVAVAQQGTQLQVLITNPQNERRWLGSWAVMFI
jgi:hypothetical protein